ncbi:hypothetical protein [Streptomyces sp. NPDC059247]
MFQTIKSPWPRLLLSVVCAAAVWLPDGDAARDLIATAIDALE